MSTSKKKPADTKVGKKKAFHSHECVLYSHEAKECEMIVAVNYQGNTHLIKVLNVRGRSSIFLQLRTMFTKESAGYIADSLTE